MQAVTRIRNFLRGRRQVWGTEKSKQALWDKEFAADHWNGLDHTKGDCVYAFIEKHCDSQGRLVADNVEGVIVKGSGHWLVDEAPEQVLPKLVSFLGR